MATNVFRSLLFPVTAFLLLLLVGCSGTPTRHLVSDVCMIKAGQTTRQEVLTLMGPPDSKRMIAPDTEEWAYFEEDRSFLQDTPLLGDSFDADGYSTVVITISEGKVTDARYSGYTEDEFDWQDDYSWQEIEEK